MSIAQGFLEETASVALTEIAPTRSLPQDIRRTRKYRTILASIRAVGLVEPLVVHPDTTADAGARYLLLDGHLRWAALRDRGATHALCLVSTEDESFTYNRRINRLSTVEEHRMIVRAIERGVPPARIAAALDVDVQHIQAQQRMLHGITAEAVELLRDKRISVQVFQILRKMTPLAQLEAAELMRSANTHTVTYAKVLLAGMASDKLVAPEKKPVLKGVSAEDLARIEREMARLQGDYRKMERELGDLMLTLVVARGYVAKVLANEAVADYLTRHYGEMLAAVRTVMQQINTARDAVRE